MKLPFGLARLMGKTAPTGAGTAPADAGNGQDEPMADVPVNFYVTAVYERGESLLLVGFNLLNQNFSVQLDKSQPSGPLALEEIYSDEGCFVVHDGEFLWRVTVSLEAPATDISLEERWADTTTPWVSDDDFQYHEFGISPVLYAQMTGAIVAHL